MLFDVGCMLSVGAVCFEDRFCASKKGRIGRGGWVSTQGGCLVRTALFGTGWTIPRLFSTNPRKKHSPALVGAPFLGL